jgi:NADH-quinone oxidoreductase subunit C
LSEIIEIIKSKITDAGFSDDILSVDEFRGQAGITIKKGHLLEIAGILRKDPALNFDLLRDLCGVDFLNIKSNINSNNKSPRFEVVYQLYSIKHKHCIRINVQVSEQDPHVASLTPIWIGANCHERECFDLFGILFDGHPDLRRILMPEDWEGYPLRKDYPVEGPEKEWAGFEEVLRKSEEYKQHQWYR